MPRTKAGKKKKAKRVSKDSEVALEDEISDLEVLLKDYDLQVKREISRLSRLFQREAKKIATASLPTKASIPRDVAKMSLVEFRSRGNSVEAVMESLKKEREEAVVVADLIGSIVTKENRDPNPVTPHIPQKADLVTPAPTTRRTTRAATAAATATGRTTRSKRRCNPAPTPSGPPQSTSTASSSSVAAAAMETVGSTPAIRAPQPEEELRVTVHSTRTGSPVDGAKTLEVHTNEVVDEFKDILADILIADLPQCHRRKVMHAIKQAKAQQESRMMGGRDVIKTPSVVR